jgi:hypothetical protein
MIICQRALESSIHFAAPYAVETENKKKTTVI